MVRPRLISTAGSEFAWSPSASSGWSRPSGPGANPPRFPVRHRNEESSSSERSLMWVCCSAHIGADMWARIAFPASQVADLALRDRIRLHGGPHPPVCPRGRTRTRRTGGGGRGASAREPGSAAPPAGQPGPGGPFSPAQNGPSSRTPGQRIAGPAESAKCPGRGSSAQPSPGRRTGCRASTRPRRTSPQLNPAP